MIKKTAQRSRELFNTGFYWAESVLLSVAESKNIQSELIPKIATGFCSGMARTGHICGAVNGAIMAISLFSGRSTPDEDLSKNYAMVQELIESFETEFGTISCKQLLGCDLQTTEGEKLFVEKNMIEQCLIYSGKATGIAMSIIEKKY